MNRETADMVKRMAWMAEYRDPATSSHLDRIRAYVNALALGIGLSSQEAEMLSVAAMLHDIGKVGLPDNLLLRVGNLTPSELEATKKHTTIGYDILKDSPVAVLQTAAPICLSHHERWDGSGYPQALRGDKIPLGGRLCGLADVFDALTTPRAYKKEISVMEARDMIRETSGQLFDPELVQAFCENFEALTKLRQLNI
jgi:putative two-component system response regulator